MSQLDICAGDSAGALLERSRTVKWTFKRAAAFGPSDPDRALPVGSQVISG